MDIQVAMAKAAARRMPLVILVLPSDVDAHDSVRATAGLPQMASIAVWHTVVQGTPEFDMLSAAAGGATAVPRIHLWPPQQRALPHATFSGEQFNTLDIRRAVLRASALVHTECETLRQQQADCSRALAKAATAVPRPSSAKPAVTQPQPVRPTSAAPTPTAAPKPAPNPAPAAPAPLTAAATSTVHVLAGKEIDQTLSLSNVRDNHTLTYFRKLVSAKLGHNNFHFQRRGQSLSSTEEERLIVGDLHDAGTPIPVHLSQAAVAMRNAKLAAEASGSSVASPTEAQSASPVEPKAQRGPMPETATSVARIDFVFPDSSVDTVEGPKTSTVSVYWARLSERLSSGSIKLVTTSPGCPDEEVTFADAHRVTLGDLLRFTKVTVRADVPKVEPVPPQDGAVKIRLVLPGGGEVTAAFAPSDSLSLVHSAASGAIDGDTNFYLQQPYPPKRYTVDDLTKSLENLGIRGNVTLRILRIATSDAQPPTDPNQPAKAGAMTGITSVMSGVASTSARFVGRLFGSGGGQPSSSAEAAAPPPAAPAPAPAARPAPRTMAEMRQREAEEEERRKAANGGANNYFGGDSTEFQAHPKKP